MPSRSTARLELAAAAVLFSTGGAAIKAADFTGWQITFLRSGIAALAIWLMTGQARGRWTGVGDWVLVGYLGVFQVALAYVLVTRALRTVAALEASLILLIEPVLNPVWAWLFQGERPGAWALLGGTVILGATAVRTALDARRGGSEPESQLRADAPRVQPG